MHLFIKLWCYLMTIITPSLSIHPSIFVHLIAASVRPSVCMSVHLYVCPSCVCINQSIHPPPFIHLSIRLSTYPPIQPSAIHSFSRRSIYPFHPFAHPSVDPSVHPSIHMAIHRPNTTNTVAFLPRSILFQFEIKLFINQHH